MFEGFPEETIRFFLDIRFHNDIAYYKAHEDEYVRYVKQPFFDFINALAPTVAQVADDIELRPEKCLARFRRDTRFTKDKAPYRDHLWLLFRRSGEPRENSVMYWFELSPETVNWGLGFWGENRVLLDELRRRMLTRPSELQDALRACGVPDDTLRIEGESYKRMKLPEELAPSLKPYYPLKDIYIARRGVALREAYRPTIVDEFAKDILRLKPMYRLFREAADVALSRLQG